MRRLKILKVYAVLWLFIFFIIYSNFKMLYEFFFTTVIFNTTTLTLLFIGLLIIIKASIELVMLTGTFAVIRYKKGQALQLYLKDIDKIFPENVANMFAKRASHQNIYFTYTEVNDVTAWLYEKFSNHKSYITFFVNLCLLIGLLGTFSGLLGSLGDMGKIVVSLQGDVNIGEVMKRLNGPITKMSIGFGSSLFGVAAAIILSLKGYILEKNQAVFIEDVQDWMNSLIIESPIATDNGLISGGSSMTQIMDVFSEKLSQFTEVMSHSNQTNEAIFKLFSQNLENNSKIVKDEMIAFENISSGIRDLNINHYQSSSSLVSSLQDLSTAVMNSNKNLKTLLDLQEKNNQLMISFMTKFKPEEKLS